MDAMIISTCSFYGEQLKMIVSSGLTARSGLGSQQA